MRSKSIVFSNFCRGVHTTSSCYRLEMHEDIEKLQPLKGLARGAGLSYSDCCVNNEGIILDTTRLNHFLAFDPTSGIVVCQPGVTFADLFHVHPDFIPPVLPGTLWATLAGGIANDVHGKNTILEGTLGHHIEWIELQIGRQSIICSRDENESLFFATIGGLGLSGIIRRIALKLQKATHYVHVQTEKFTDLESVLAAMKNFENHSFDYQAAWLDLLNSPRAVLFRGTHCSYSHPLKKTRSYKIPFRMPRLVTKWNMQNFNHFYFLKKHNTFQKLTDFNNPLDKIKNWNYLYGSRGLLQFQAVFEESTAASTIMHLLTIIQECQAVPTLAVLKYFTQSGPGLLSFVKPGFCIAIDFIHNESAQLAIKKMNSFITEVQGKIYLAKDLFLTAAQFKQQYEYQEDFKQILYEYGYPTCSDLGKRLGLIT